MVEREKIMMAAEICTKKGATCEECPYDSIDDIYSFECMGELIADMYELLKAQEPRVLTLEEALEADICWAEAKGNNRIIPARLYYGKGDLMPCTGSVTIRKLIADPEELPKEVYGTDWRCWSARPTKGQREAAPWK